MRKQAGPYTTLYWTLLGGGVGALTGGAINKLRKKKFFDRKAMGYGALAGAGIGGTLGFLKSKPRPKGAGRLEPGFYYATRDLMPGNRAVQDIPFFDTFGRHSFLAAVFDKKPSGVTTLELPNGQYVATLAGYKGKDNSTGSKRGLFVDYVGGPLHSKTCDNDVRSMRAHVDASSEKNWDPEIRLWQVARGDAKGEQLLRSATEYLPKNKSQSVGKYSVFSWGSRKGNCNTVAAALLKLLNLTDNLPWRIGSGGGVSAGSLGEATKVIRD